MTKVIQLSDYRRAVDHQLCRQCPNDATCSNTCIAIEVLVKLAQTRRPMEQLEGVYNVGTQLDLQNSF